jgi:hypothetical protein
MAAGVVHAQVSVTTAQNDNSRTGANLTENILTTSNVKVSQFGQLFSRAVDGYLYAQPLYVPHVTISGTTHNVIFAATMNDSVYAFDADNPNVSAPLWQTSLGTAVPATTAYLPENATGGLAPTTGILSTPVIDLNTGTLYAVALVLAGNPASATYQLHALDITTGAEKSNSPVTLQASVDGSGPDSVNGVITFDASEHLQRTGLLLVNGNIYFAFASYGDITPYHGWVMGYSETTLQQTAVLNVAPGGQGGIWQSGGGLSADSSGFVYLCTGNGAWDGTVNFGESCLKLNPSQGLSVTDFFTPYNYSSLNATDSDLGSGRALLIPGTSLLVTGGKEGSLYVLNQNNLGQLTGGNTNIVQEFDVSGKVYSGLAYWNNPSTPTLFVWGADGNLAGYQFSGGLFNTNPASVSSITAPYGSAVSISSNAGTAGSGIVWATTPSASPGQTAVPGTLHAFDATNLSNELWNSDQNSARDALGNIAKFAAPTIANGKVYVPTFSNQLAVYGLLSNAPLSVSPSVVSLGASQIQPFNANLSVTWAINPSNGSITSGGTYTAPATVSSSETVTVTATSLDQSQSATATINLIPVAVSVSPAAVNLYASQTQQFSAAVVGIANTSVTWSINPVVGSISSAGLYTAPASIGSIQPVTVTATSVADNTKLATASVTLNPPVVPTITQQPKNATAFSGQPATFTVTATGGALAYQWQSEASGAGSFTNITGAVSSSYSSSAVTVSENGTLFRCIVTNSQGSVPSSAATLTVLAPGSTFVTATTLGTLRNNFTGWVGMSVTVQNVPLVVTALGRMVAPENTQTHTVKIVNGTTGADITGASVSINVAGAATGTFVYNSLATPVVLSATGVYYILSQETAAGDQFYDNTTAVLTTNDAILSASVYGAVAPYDAVPGTAGFAYVPVDFLYNAISATPLSASLYASQTQQFAAAVVGLGTSNVSWSLSPNSGSISANGLYTAPSLILSAQSISVIATSVADPTKSASASVNLIPVAMTISPLTGSLFAGQTQQFTPTVTGSSNTSVTWSLNPTTLGSVSSSGLYTAPGSVSVSENVTVIATSVADPTKSSSAVVALAPPIAPVITQQPQNLTIIAGQTGTFTVIATGGSLTYQWQSMPPGAGSFSNIGGATASLYTTPVMAQTGSATQYRCIVTNIQGSTTTSAAVLTVVSPGAHFVTSTTLGTLRNDFSGWVGMNVTVGANPLVVTTLGRIVAPGNTAAHTVKIVDASGNDVPGTAVSVNTAGVTAGTFAYAALQSTVTLSANTSYFIVSQESNSGDQWYDSNTLAQTTNIAVLNGPAYLLNGVYLPLPQPGQMFVPVDFSIPISITVTPTAASLSDGQTQQFIASVTGNNTAVNWSINPSGAGSISNTGLYTAPSPVSGAQTVTVAATSVADITQFAIAVVTLNPPAAPTITQQPQNATSFVGQTATFSVTATGVGLAYQWQSMARGAGSFTNIAGATSSSYTTPASVAGDNGTQFQCIVSNRVASVTSSAATLTVIGTGTSFVTSETPGTLRNDFTGWVGMTITVGPSPLMVGSLGRMVAPGNSAPHTVKIVDANTSLDIPGATVIVNTTGTPAGSFAYGLLPGPVTLNANGVYFVLSQETQGGDQWYNIDTVVRVTSDATLTSAAYGASAPFLPIGSSGQLYGPLDFKYITVAVAPPTAVLTSSETQQFSAVTAGTTNPVTWSISPAVGSISASGLYTAPASITSIQSVTVTAFNGEAATATITLNPPATITQQPADATVFAGEQATFTVVASGTGLTYQWQSMAPGATSFSNIAGATASSYTTPPNQVSDGGTQFICVVTSTQLPVASNPATLTVLTAGATFVTPTALGHTRNDVTGWAGMSVTVGPVPLVVTALGRMIAPGNNGTHSLKIVDASTGLDVPQAATSINAATGTAGTFLYGPFTNRITLNANATYYILSQETQGGDSWYSDDTTVVTSADGTLVAAVLGGPPYTPASNTANQPYGPLDFVYVSIGVTPLTSTLQALQTQQFSATTEGIGSSGVTWSLSPAVGTISANGLYTAPAVVGSSQTVTVTATPQFANVVTASAVVTLVPVAISAAPQNVTLVGSQTQQFTATVTGSSNTSVTWSINPSNAGTISASGLYTALSIVPSAQTVTVTATSVADNTKVASVTVNLTPVSVGVSPNTITLFALQTEQFTATVNGTTNTAVVWSVSPSSGAGSISSGGLYTAPSPITSIQTVTVTATSVADSTKLATATVTLSPNPPGFAQQPVNATVYQGAVAQFAVIATGLNLTYQWQSMPSGATTFTNIAGAVASSYTVPPTALANNGTQYQCVVTNPEGVATSQPATLTVLSAGASFVSSVTLGTLRSDFTGWVGMNITVGAAPLQVRSLGRWVVAGNTNAHTVKIVNAISGADVAGASVSINTAGIAPGVFVYAAFPTTVTLAANNSYYILSQETQNGDQWYDSDTSAVTTADATLVGAVFGSGTTYSPVGLTGGHTYVPVDFKYVSVGVSPTTANLSASQNQQFTAIVSGMTGGVTWSLSPSIGTIDSTGLYTAPSLIAIQQTINVTATSVTDPTKSATAALTLMPVAVTIAPTSIGLFNSQTQQFTATVTGSSNSSVAWTLNPTNAGTVSSNGLYTAPAVISATQTVTLTATSAADTSKFATTSIFLSPPTPPVITQQPQNVTVIAGQTATFSVTVTALGNPTYQWQSLTPGANAFSNIAGATSSSYTTPAAALTDNGTQFQCLVTNSLGSTTSNPAELTVAAPAVNFVTSTTLGQLSVPDFTGFVGMSITVGSNPLTLASLGRFVVAGNSGVHTVKVVDGSTLLDVPGASVSIDTTTGTPGSYTYAAVTSPVTLNAGAIYYILSSETNGGDTWYDSSTSVQTTNAALLTGPMYGTPYSPPVAATGYTYGPVDFSYNILVSINLTPTAVTLYGGQTQQFTSSVVGNNTSVTWSLNPSNLGSITSSGLYTAPTTITSQQTLTVTATSVADPSKFATSTVTLSPPTPPIITQQPQNVQTFVGDTATFSITAVGRALTYQWQSMAPGSGSFTNIVGATSVSYTTSATALSNNATQYQCVVTNPQGVVTSAVAYLGVLTPGGAFLTSETLGTLRGNFTGWVGMSLTVGSQPLVVSALGRIVAPGNTNTHVVKIVSAAGVDIPGASVTVSTAGQTSGTFTYGALSAPITLAANTNYYVVSQEVSGTDVWYDSDTTAVPTADAVLNAPVYNLGSGYNVITTLPADHLYVPVNFQYVVAVSVGMSPPTASLSGGQTQQFTATVTGNSNTAVTWSISPSNLGSISSAGVYTAPGSIAAQQTVIVTATSVADITKSASATVTLMPVAVSITPPTVILFDFQTQQFTANVTGTSNTTVSWAISPSNVGSISANGLYTAPAPIVTQQTVTVTATSGADNTKFGNATITLSPPAAPVITQQPQSANISTGQTATFTITALGGGLTYQWQSLPLGASTFTSIAGATSNSYTTPAVTLAGNGTLYQCVVTNAQGAVTSNSAEMTVSLTAVNYVTSFTLGTTSDNDFTGFIGMGITVGNTPLVVRSLGRMVAPGNTSSHIVKIVDASTGLDVPNAFVTVNTAGATAGTFVYGTLSSPVTLNANATYYMVSQEVSFGDQWYSNGTGAQTTNAATLNGVLWGPPNWQFTEAPGQMWGPIDFTYIPPISVTVSPTAALLFASQTQQFTAAVNAAANPAVTWSITPTTGAGTISQSGLYTAPASITAQQNVVVTATSVTDTTKSATATVTLSPPAPPIITQQPQNASVVETQTAVFSVTAAGIGLSYQWQSMPNGATSFTNIAGATSPSYTTPATLVTDNATQFLCLVTNAQGTTPSNVATLTVLAPGSNFVTSTTLGQLSDPDLTGFVGMSITVGSNPMTLTALGRFVVAGNSGFHTVKVVDASTLLDVPGASVSIDTASGTAGAYTYLPVTATVTLNGNATYYIVSAETNGGDTWYDSSTAVQTTNAAVLNGPVYETLTQYLAVVEAGHTYGPVDFSYTIPVSVTVSPSSASLFGAQTQQFSATLAGNSNTSVTWSISPSNVGSISAAGLYTAPGTISTQQTVTVTATSVADATKVGNAIVTLNPPTPPTITQQPQNVLVFAGQTATFNVTATGGGLTYQWQSMASGASVFSSIAGATSASYATPATTLNANGTQFQCLVTNTQGTIQSSAASLTVLTPGSDFITSNTPGTLRNNYPGWVGMSITVGAQPILVSSLGRLVAPGNTGTHTVKIVTAAGVDIPGATASIATAGGTTGAFAYGGMTSPVSLSANTIYYIVSQETLGGDQWYDSNTTEQTTTDAVLNGPVYGTPYAPLSGLANHAYVPVDFVYNISVSVSVAPLSATLFNGQTEQFTATVTGNNNTAVTWTINPAGAGSISTTGLYTAPGSITTGETVSVTATSVADSTKSATATVTLSPPAPPSITQQPQSSTAVAGQTASFSVTALGNNVTYQWQSEAPGGSTFTNIGGATSSSYTTPAATLSENATQYQCVVTNLQGSVISNPATLTVLPAGTTFVTSKTLGTLRSDFTGWVGMSVTTGSQSLVVSSLGRIFAPGNTGTHLVEIVNASTSAVVGSVSVAMTGGTSGAFVYGILTTPVTLSANTIYYILSAETQAGDQWYSDDTTAQTTTDAKLSAAVWGIGSSYTAIAGTAGTMFVPVDFKYNVSVSVSVSPTTATLFATQTQLFTATVTGSNTAVTWSITPSATGSISSSGLYTAPGTVSSQQTVTVTATSVADTTKLASATVTLNPPAPPVITQQPQSATAVVGQTANFTVTAIGVGLSYQWQSMPSGANVFGSISGATSSTYTTPAVALANNGTQFQCVVTNAQGSVTSTPATLAVIAQGTDFVVSKILGTSRNDYTGWVGMSMTVGSQPLVVTSLGRIVAPGNSSAHTVKIVNAANGVDVAGASATVNTVGGTAGTFAYGNLSGAITLSANTTYYIVSQETLGGDQWYSIDTSAQVTTDGILAGGVYGSSPTYDVIAASAGHMFVPVDFKYTIPISVAVNPTTANLYGSQTEQFAATITGSSNTSVTWTINPANVGSISSFGLYTPPASIGALQTVTVTATSVADITKSANATVTLNPPGPPTITQQPQNATAPVGQTATFTVVAGGGGLSYQWQSMPSGAGSFSNISGATSSSYTTPVTVLSNTGTQFQCVITNAQGTITSNAATLTVSTGGNTFITSKTLGTLRDDYTGWVGMSLYVGSQPVVVSALGRIVVASNSSVHVVKIVTASTGNDLTSVSVPTSGGTAGTFTYVNLATPVTLSANTTYYILSQETAAGDQWYSSDTTAQTTTDATLAGAVWGGAAPYSLVSGTSGHLFVPVDFQYTISVSLSVSPTAVNLFDGQSQQFTATLTGNSNTSVTWSISPNNVGSISSTGFYAAPTSITTQQTVTVTATSVAIPSIFASATVSLYPPAPPTITQQPQNSTASVGQTASFSVIALGTGLSYQWQSEAPGAGSFSSISDANSSTYTTPATILSNNGTQYQCVVTNAQGSVTSNAATLTVLAPGTIFVTSKTLGTLRNNYTGWVGMSVTVGSQPLIVSSVGRIVATGNVNTHTVKIVASSTGLDVTGGSAPINTATGTAGTFSYGTLGSPVTLAANTTYYILSQETLGGDQWYNSDTTAQTTTDATLAAAVYGAASPSYSAIAATAGHMFVPVDFEYTVFVSVQVSPTTAILFASQTPQTQQFAATVTGSNPAVTWTIAPSSVGSISSSGLYTAPGTISSQQTVTVTATSVADTTKSASAAVTLNPPAPPAITQQPQTATVAVGQTATFTVTAVGTGLSYQWQSMPASANTFGNISGAMSSSYTTPAVTLTNNGAQFQCVVTNTQGSVTSNPATLAVIAPGSAFVTSTTLVTLRNNFSGWVGMSVKVGAQPLMVSSLGRIVAPGNTGTHTVKIVTAATGADLPGGSASVSTASGTTGTFNYGSLASPVTLGANTTYYILSQETLGGDQWYDSNTTAQITSDATLAGAVWGTGSPYALVAGTAGQMYVPVNFEYTIPVSVNLTPAAVTLFGGQTQPFTATVGGSGNTSVTWQINPSGAGSISIAGLYTAPSSITTQQTVTVTATSVADITKSASASITLSPPSPPTITQQPQSATIVVGQSATFTVTALGGTVTYQWQSMLSGGGSFSNVAGATSSSYTTPVSILTQNGTQFQCIVTNGQGFTTSNAATLTVVTASTKFLTSTTLGSLRSNYSGWVGMSVTVGAQPLDVGSLGRIVASGNSSTHLVKIVNATGIDVVGASVSVNVAGGTPGTFVYAALLAPVTLSANATYYIVSQETQGSDQWYDLNTSALTTTDATLAAAVYGAGSSYTPVSATAGHPYVPVDFEYAITGH